MVQIKTEFDKLKIMTFKPERLNQIFSMALFKANESSQLTPDEIERYRSRYLELGGQAPEFDGLAERHDII